MSRRLVVLVCGALAGAEAGCASTSAAVGGSPEAAIAGAIQQYRRRVEGYAVERRAVVRDRLALRQLAEEDAARVRAEASSRVAVWRIAGDRQVIEVYQHVVDASREGGEAVEELDRLRAEGRAALDKADTRTAVRGDKLAAAAKALSALAEQRSLASVVKAYLAFLATTDGELKKLRRPAPEGGAAVGALPPPQ